MPLGSHIICWCMALLVAAAPIPFGSVHPIPLAVVQVAITILAAVWMMMRIRAGLSSLPWKDPILIGGGALFAYGLLQILPIPTGAISWLSPGSAAIWVGFSPESPTWSSLSIDPYTTWRSCLLTLCWTLAAVVVRHNAVDLKGRLIVAGGFVTGGLFQAAYGLFEFISGRQKVFWLAKTAFIDVATGTFISRNNFAGYLEMCLPFALALGLLRSKAFTRRHGPSIKQRLAEMSGRTGFRTVLLLMTAFVMGVAVLMSRSRMGIVSTATALIVVGFVPLLKKGARRLALVSLATVILVGAFASEIDIAPVINRFRAFEHEFGTGYGRLRVWTQSLSLLAAYPIFGSGMGTWEMAFSPFRDDATQVRVDFAHNDYLEFGAESGAFGVLVITGAILLGLSRKRRQQLSGGHQDEIGLAAGMGLLAIGLHSITDFHFSIPANALGVSLLLGLFLRPAGPASPLGAQRTTAHGSSLRRLPAWGFCVCLVMAIGISAVTPAMGHVSSVRAGMTQEPLADPDSVPPDDRAASPDDQICPACRFEPFNSARYVEAASRARRRLLRDVETLVRAWTVGIVPEHSTKTYLAARIDRSLALVHEGLQLAPARARGHIEEGLLHFGRFALTGLPPSASDDFGRAIASFSRGLELAPWHGPWHRKVTMVTMPLFEQCNQEQKSFLERTARRARAIDPKSAELKQAVARFGI